MQSDLMMIPLKELCDIPIIYDPSHAAYRNFVPRYLKGAMKDGLIIESHPNPTESISDSTKPISLETLKEIVEDIK